MEMGAAILNRCSEAIPKGLLILRFTSESCVYLKKV